MFVYNYIRSYFTRISIVKDSFVPVDLIALDFPNVTGETVYHFIATLPS